MDDDEFYEYVDTFTKKELQIIYGLSYKAFESWIADIIDAVGEEKGKKYNLMQIEIIFRHKGVPRMLRMMKRRGTLNEYFRTRNPKLLIN